MCEHPLVGRLNAASQVPQEIGEETPEVSFSYLLDEGSHVQCAEWCLLCRFDNHCVPAAQRGSNFPGEHQQGEVPLEGKSKVSRGDVPSLL